MPSMYDACVPTFVRALTNLIHVLEKGAAHAEAKKIDPLVLTGSRLYPDMFPLARQVQIASDIARIGTARIAQAEHPKFEDTETTFPELVARVKKTIEYVDSISAPALEGAETRVITLKLRDRTLEFKGLEFLQVWALPNFFFHHVTAYNLLRHNGVDLGKRDFLGR